MIKSCLPEDTQRAWQRYSARIKEVTQISDGEAVLKKSNLTSLISFSKREVTWEEGLQLDKLDFENTPSRDKNYVCKKRFTQ